MALPRANRLSLRFERERISTTGKTFYGKFFTVISAKQETPSQSPRFAILVSKKTARLAVNRNKIKRITSSLIENILPTIPPNDYLVIPKHQTLELVNKDLQKDIQAVLSKIKLEC
jgi:ribonuclease P protein component